MLPLLIPLLGKLPPGNIVILNHRQTPDSLFGIFCAFLIRKAVEVNQHLRSEFSSTLSATLDDVDVANSDILSSTNGQSSVS